MGRLITHPTTVAEWHALVTEAENKYGKQLAQDLESYLVFLLQRFTNRPEIANTIAALEYLQSQQAGGTKQRELLRDVGDHCLLVTGLFPERAIRRLVPVSYFVEIGRRAYSLLASLHPSNSSTGDLYTSLRKNFIYLMDTLQCMREMAGKDYELSPIQAEELWRNTGSDHAREILQQYCKALPQFGDDSDPNMIH